MATTVLVTGANGFVGSHILEALQRCDGLRVVAACRDRSSIPSTFNGEVRAGDLRNSQYLESAVKGIDVLCHAAAWSSLWGRRAESGKLFLEPSLSLIEAALSAGVSRFVNTSTASAASPQQSADPMSRGIPRAFWPHLCSIVAVENRLRERASNSFRVVNLRLGIFAGKRYGLGVLPILLPRLKTHLVPWVDGGKTSLPIVDGEDIGEAFALAVSAPGLGVYESFNIVGPEVPTVRTVIEFLHAEFGYPQPHFSVPFSVAYPFAWLMETLDPIVPWEPLVTRSIVHLLEEVSVDNRKAENLLGYRPRHRWQDAVRKQVAEMRVRETQPMKMYRPIV